MSKLMSSSSTPADARGRINQTRGLSMLAAAGVLVAVVLGGCGPEARENWTWNPFDKKSKTTAPDAGTKARRPAPPPPPATASNNQPNQAKPSADDQKAEQVNRDVGNYANSFPDKNKSKPSGADPRTPAIDDDRSLADASPSGTRAQRTSARPTPTPAPTHTTPPPPPPSTSSGSLGEELVLMPTNSNTTTSNPPPPAGNNTVDIPSNTNTGNTGQPSNVAPESTSIAMNQPANNPQATHSEPNPTESMNAATTEDEAPANARPPVLGGIEIESGTDSAAAMQATDAPANETHKVDNTKITPTPIRPIDTDKPMTPVATDAPHAENPAPTPPAPKPAIQEPKPKPTPSEVTPFEDRNDEPAPAKPEPVKPQPVKPAPIEPKAADPTKPTPPPAIAAPPTPSPAPTPTANNVKSPTDNPARQIADMEAIVARQPNNIDQQLKLRMRYLEQGDETRALQPTPGMSEDVERTIIAQIKSVIAAKSADGRTAPEAANKQLQSAEAIRAGATAKADLLVPKVALCTAIRAFGDYTPIEPPTFPAGRNNRVLVYIEVENFMSKQMEDGQYKTVLSLRESLLDARGKELWSQQNPPVEDINRQRRRDFFLTTGERPISAKLPPGEYFYKVEVEDLQASKVNSAKTQFKLVAVGKN